jgi:uncharacterized membrane protein
MCALHPASAAERICDRCGNFMCSQCSEGEHALCPTCRVRAAAGEFPLRRESWSFGGLWGYCWGAFQREWLMLSVVVLLFFVIVAMLGIVGQLLQTTLLAATGGSGDFAGTGHAIAMAAVIAVGFQALSLLAQGLFEMGMYRVYLDVLGGRSVDVARMFSQFNRAGTMLVQKVLIILAVLIPFGLFWGLLLLLAAAAGGALHGGGIPDFEQALNSGAALVILGVGAAVSVVVAFYFYLPFYFATPELVLNQSVGAMESLRNCYTLAKDNRWNIFGVALVAGLVMVVGIFLCCIGLLPSFALGQLVMSGLFLALRNGSTLHAPPAS